MLRTTINGANLALNAFGGVYEYWSGSSWVHTPVALHSGCYNDNPDCLWIYRDDRMIVSARDQSFAINAWGGAGQDVRLMLTTMCSPTNPDCTWSFINGQFVSDGNPSLKWDAPNGAYDGTPVQLRSTTATTFAFASR